MKKLLLCIFAVFGHSQAITHITQEQAKQQIEKSSTDVFSNASKVVIGINKLNEEDLEKADSTEGMTTWDGKPLSFNKGVKFKNAKESDQIVKVDGSGVIIVNEVTPENAETILKHIQSLKTQGYLSLANIQNIIQRIKKMGYQDIYDSDVVFIKANMTPAFPERVDLMLGTEEQPLGFFKRDARDVCKAFYVEGHVTFEGPAASDQEALQGAYIVKQGDNPLRLIQKNIFERTYRRVDGKPFSVEDFAQYKQ